MRVGDFSSDRIDRDRRLCWLRDNHDTPRVYRSIGIGIIPQDIKNRDLSAIDEEKVFDAHRCLIRRREINRHGGDVRDFSKSVEYRVGEAVRKPRTIVRITDFPSHRVNRKTCCLRRLIDNHHARRINSVVRVRIVRQDIDRRCLTIINRDRIINCNRSLIDRNIDSHGGDIRDLTIIVEHSISEAVGKP